MALYISSLNSGSNGNCYYIGNTQEAILVDAGISCRETEKRMKRLGLSMDRVKAIFVSHEHSDHIRGIETLSRKYRLPVYMTPGTFLCCGLSLDGDLVNHFHSFQPVNIGYLVVTPFPKNHDASDPHSFVVSCQDVKVGIFTDLGTACPTVVNYFSQCQAAFLETNYDEDLLFSGRYPYFLKRRISGDKGHLSNRQALELFTAHRGEAFSHLLLSHLSADNNRPDLVEKLFLEYAGNTQIVVAPRTVETPVFTVDN